METNELRTDIYDYLIVGGGIIGISVGYKLSLKFPKKSILVLEKESSLAQHQTGRNSGVIHSGIYYPPESYKAKNCIDGRKQLLAFAKQHQIKHTLCGKLIVATQPKELPVLENIFQNGIKNGLSEIRMLNQEESKVYEPFTNCIASIFVPYAGIIDYVSFTNKMADLLLKLPQNKIQLDCKVLGTKLHSNNKEVITTKGSFYAEKVIFAAGLQSDELAEMDGIALDSRIIGFRGDYYNVIGAGKQKVKSLIYPVPDINLPFLGVHLTTMHDGSIEAGPNAVLSFKKEGYKTNSFSWHDTKRAIFYVGFWKLLISYWKIGIAEFARALSKKRFLKSTQELVPNLKKDELIRGKSGVRAQAVDKSGNLIKDFVIKKDSRSVHIINAPSPAATASLAIADEILKHLE